MHPGTCRHCKNGCVNRTEVVVGRYQAVIRTVSGVYSSEVKNDTQFEEATRLAADFAKREGRQPRIMIAKLGQDGHDRGAKGAPNLAQMGGLLLIADSS